MLAKVLSMSVSAVVVMLAARTSRAEAPPSGVEGTRRSPAGWPAVAEKKSQDAAAIAADVIALAHYSNEMSIELGKLAEQRGASARVKRLGTLLVADRERADRALLRYATRERGLTVESTSQPGDERPEAQESMRAKQHLRTLSGPAFDRELLALVVADHYRALADLRNYGQMVNDPDLRALFGKMAPVLRQDLMIAIHLTPPEGE
jgi:predicted outer membrane protein